MEVPTYQTALAGVPALMFLVRLFDRRWRPWQ